MNRSKQKVLRAAALALVGVGLWGCQYNARSPEDYRDAAANVIATQDDQVRSCYDAAFKADPTAAGSVQVRFTVQAETGKFINSKVIGGTAPNAVKQCVVNSLDGLQLTPPDKRDGDATFVWMFTAPKPAS
jgi:hypothetical protein